MASAAARRRRIREQLHVIADHARQVPLLDIVGHTERVAFADWPTPSLALCLYDPNTRQVGIR